MGKFRDAVAESLQVENRAGVVYDTEVNRGSVNMRNLKVTLNARTADGWRLHTIFSQDGNTVIIYERDAA